MAPLANKAWPALLLVTVAQFLGSVRSHSALSEPPDNPEPPGKWDLSYQPPKYNNSLFNLVAVNGPNPLDWAIEPPAQTAFDEGVEKKKEQLHRRQQTLAELIFDQIYLPTGPAKEHIRNLLALEQIELGSYTPTWLILKRLGYELELHNCTSRDGYITQLIQVLPSRAQPEAAVSPVALYAGPGVSAAVFVGGSLPAQHRNRSIALALLEQGFQVWLIPARSSDPQNMGFNRPAHERDYWSYGLDDLIQLEFGAQISLMLQVSRERSFSLVVHGAGGLVSFAFLAANPEWVARVDHLVALAPAIFPNPANLLLRTAGLAAHLDPADSGLLLHGLQSLDSGVRPLWIQFCVHRLLRYSVCKRMLDLHFGPSDTFNTFLELSLLQHLGRAQSTRSLRHQLQIADLSRLARLDLGPLANQLIYRTFLAPEYPLAQLKHPNLYLFSAKDDALCTEHSIAKLLSRLGREPRLHVVLENYNNLDLLAGWNVDQLVVEPIVTILARRQPQLGPAQLGSASAPDSQSAATEDNQQ